MQRVKYEVTLVIFNQSATAHPQEFNPKLVYAQEYLGWPKCAQWSLAGDLENLLRKTDTLFDPADPPPGTL